MAFLSDTLARVKPSPTIAVTTKAQELKAAGRDIIGLGAGEPDFDTPDHIKTAAIQAIKDGFTRYTAVDGTPSLKQAIIAKFKGDNGLDYAADQILVSCGGKQSFYNLCQAMLNTGDEVIIPAPYWVSYPDMVLLAEGEPVIVATGVDSRFKISPQQLEAAITPATKALVFVSPSNPTGAVYSPEMVKAIGEWALAKGIWVITDEIYEHLVYGDAIFSSIPTLVPELADRCVVINGVAKTYAMTGWRVGWMIAPPDVTKAATNLQSHATSNVANMSRLERRGPSICSGYIHKQFTTKL